MKSFSVSSSRTNELIDITDLLSAFVREGAYSDGVLIAFVPHTTAGITINENSDPAVVTDTLEVLDRLIPLYSNYKHAEGNSAAHVKASLMGSSVSIVVSNSKLLLGTWQGVYFCEFDGPRNRKLLLKFIAGS